MSRLFQDVGNRARTIKSGIKRKIAFDHGHHAEAGSSVTCPNDDGLAERQDHLRRRDAFWRPLFPDKLQSSAARPDLKAVMAPLTFQTYASHTIRSRR